MKKIIFFIFVLSLYFFPRDYARAQTGATECFWKILYADTPIQPGVPYGFNAVKYSGGCESGEIKSSEEKCTPAEKPSISFGEAKYPQCCCGGKISDDKPKFLIPELQISLPALKLSEATCIDNDDGTSQCSIPWISQYLMAVYNYGLSIAGILAALMLMAGGVLWLVSAGDASRVTQAKELITGSITGIIILFTSYIILIQINPNLTKFYPITLGSIKRIDLIPTPENIEKFSANCVPQTTGACAVSNMSVFGEKASQASAICNAESGGDPLIYNKLTRCTGGEYAVWGLFQFNLSANTFTDERNNVLQCPKAFNKTWTNSSPSCTVIDSDLYNKCVAAATNPTLSILNAQKLSAESKTAWGPWEANSKWCHFQ